MTPHLLLHLRCRLTGATCYGSQWTLPRLHQPSSTRQMSSLTDRLDYWSYRRSCGSENGTRALKVSPNEMAPPTNPPTPA